MPGAARHLVVFVREPRLGRIKRRLAADVGAVAAWAFYRRNLADVLRRLRDPRWRCWLAITPDAAVSADGMWPDGWRRVGQRSGDLGQRMGRVMRAMPPGPVVVVGTDIPGLGARHVAAAFDALGRDDAVFGPATDGGYWLVGLRRVPRVAVLFDTVRWSSPNVLADTEANARRQGLTIARLETLEDVDDGASYARWRRRSTSPTGTDTGLNGLRQG